MKFQVSQVCAPNKKVGLPGKAWKLNKPKTKPRTIKIPFTLKGLIRETREKSVSMNNRSVMAVDRRHGDFMVPTSKLEAGKPSIKDHYQALIYNLLRAAKIRDHSLLHRETSKSLSLNTLLVQADPYVSIPSISSTYVSKRFTYTFAMARFNLRY